MADYTIIADVSQQIVKILREKMCPEPIPSPNNIEVASPSSKDVDYVLGVYLYDIRLEPEMGLPNYIQYGRGQTTKPPRTYALYYMIYINGGGQSGLKDLDVQKILGRVAQIVEDYPSVDPNAVQTWLEGKEPPIVLSQARIGMDEKTRVWQVIQKPYQVALFYKAAPVYLSSEIVHNPARVVSADFNLSIPE